MFKTKHEVQKHVDSCLRNINNETERNLRCFAFGKLYFNVGDYQLACRYISTYLSVKPNSAEGHQFLGKAFEKLGKTEAALDAYRTSLELNSHQNNLVMKICELLSQDNVNMDQSVARYYCELAQNIDAHNPAVYSLRERLITSRSENPAEVSNLLLKELESRPTDPKLRINLIKHLLQNNMIKEAYKHALAIEEMSSSIFQNNLCWYETVAEVLIRYQKEFSLGPELGWQFWFNSVLVLDRLVSLSLDENCENVRTSSEFVNNLFNFDQMLSKATQNLDACPDKPLVAVFLDHYQAQLHFHLAVLIFKLAKCDLIQYKEAANITISPLLIAYHCSPPNVEAFWLLSSSQTNKKLVNRWYKEASFRCSQAGHILLSAAKNRSRIIMDRATQFSTGQWREHLFKKAFVKRDQQQKMSTSFFVSHPEPVEPLIKLPDPDDLLVYDEAAQSQYPDSLHHYIWSVMNSDLVNFSLKTFEGLQYSRKNVTHCAAESISILDLESFIYCATLCAKSKNENITQNMVYYNKFKPSVLPASLTETLGTLNQSKFIFSAYKMYLNEHKSNMGEIRLLLIKGIEVVRCCNHHGLDTGLLVSLAQIFEERALKLKKQSEVDANEARAELYWKTAIPFLERLKNNQTVIYPNNRLFEYNGKEITISEATSLIEKGKLFLGVQLMKKKELEKASKMFEQLRDPYASFYQSQIYKSLADEKTNQNKENVTSEMRSQNIILLSKARDSLYLTLDRLRDSTVDRNHPLNNQLGTEIEKIERLLSRIDPDCANGNDCGGMSDDNRSSDNSVEEHYLTTYTTTHSFQNGPSYTPKHSTPVRYKAYKHEARPSPERLDAQIRQLTANKETVMNGIQEQIKSIMDSHKNLIEEFKNFSISHGGNNTTVNDIKKSVDDLKGSVDDVQNVMDVVKEIKKEIADIKKDITDIKKDQNKNNLSEEDLYVLGDNEYVDYNISANLSGVYTGYPPGRMGNAGALPPAFNHPGLYAGLYPGLAYAYGGGLGMHQPGALPFPDQQLQGAIAASAAVSYPPPVLGQLSLSQALPYPQAASQAWQPLRDSPKATPSQSVLGNFTTTVASVALIAAPSTSSLASSTTSASRRAAPVNVVITSSDPLPFNRTPTTQPVLSVTIPPQHIKGNINAARMQQQQQQTQPHNYQIAMPSTGLAAVASAPSILSRPPPVVSTQSLLSNISAPVFSAVSQTKSPLKNVSLGFLIEKTLDQTFSPSQNNVSLNKSNASAGSAEEHDPCPDFKPIIPLPDEVPVNTGEEGEVELFCERAKLFRHVTQNDVKEWKERGVGNLKILRSPETGKVRLLMRRDQVHKICANHFITKDMMLTPMSNNDRAYVWAAHDYADENVVLEKFCVRFKTSADARKFYEAFESAKKTLAFKETSKATSKANETNRIVDTPNSKITAQTSLGGFVFTSTPTFMPKDNETVTRPAEENEPTKPSPFSSFSFGTASNSSNLFQNIKPMEAATFSPLVICQDSKMKSPLKDDDKDTADDFVPTAEFKPVVALPELVEIVTGEENSEVIFEGRAKLFRYDTNGQVKEWKERGVGVLKVLKEDSIRIVMRRDQVHKVCCNHKVLKNMSFKQNTGNPKTVVWHAQDFSEGVLTPQTFTARFKTEDIAAQFLQVIQSAQTSLDENNMVGSKHHKPNSPRARTTSFGEKFKPAKGSWECKNCYIVNEGKSNICIACETPKLGSGGKDKDNSGLSGPVFSFGVPLAGQKAPEEAKASAGLMFGQEGGMTSWGDSFRPAAGSWECKTCYIRNTGDKDQCVSCETPKDGPKVSAQAQGKSILKGVNLDTPGQSFAFGMVPIKIEEKTPAAAVSKGFGDAFKPKSGSWECKVCLIRNQAQTLYCLSCETPKDDTVLKKEASKPQGVNLDTPGQKFTFGMPQQTQPTTPQAAKSFSFDAATAPSQFSFATKSETMIKPVGLFETPTKETFTFKSSQAENKGIAEEKADRQFVFGSPQKHDFEFKPRSPRRSSQGQGEDGDEEEFYEEEEEDNIYFKPALSSLPDIVEIKTGEEEEDVLYCHRAKLFRFVGGEWKERGLGDIKILRRKDNGKLRVVMRREQILKICLNHWLTSDVEYLPKDEKSWLFYANDYSEGEISSDRFCLRFKNEEVAQNFKKAVTDALESDIADKEGKKWEAPKSETSDNSYTVEFVGESEVTSEEEKEALRLGLPYKFFSYRQREDCPCEQCKVDDVYLDGIFSESLNIPLTPRMAPKSAISSVYDTSTAPSSSSSSVFTTPRSFTFSPGRPTSSDTLKDLLLKPSVLELTSKSPEQTEKEKPVELKKTESSIMKNFSFTGATASLSKPTTPGAVGNTSTSGCLFGSPSVTGGFTAATAGNGSVTSTTSIFESGTSSSVTNIFGARPCSNNLLPSKLSVFGNSTKRDPPSVIFEAKESSTSVFTPSSETISNKSFTTSSEASTEPVGESRSDSVLPIFGKQIFVKNPAENSSSGNVHGAKSPFVGGRSIFGNKSENQLGANLSFGALSTNSSEKPKKNDEIVLKCDSSLSFASLASGSSENSSPAFGKAGDNNFSFMGTGTPVFKGTKQQQRVKKSEKKSESEEEGGNNEDNYDPHYDPIVPLPDAIAVTTGEEDEEVLFNERAKLFRFDANTKEWKERGVGQMKILYHSQNQTYRFLMRREQVHKVVLNQRITPSVDPQPLMSSDKAWMWAGYNYTDDDNLWEKLAVRFKNCELAKKFYDVSADVLNKVVELNNKSIPETVTNTNSIENVGSDDQNNIQEQNVEEYDEDEEEDDEDDERSIMFIKRVTLSELNAEGAWKQITMGELQVFYDSDLYAVRIAVNDDEGNTVTNTIIGLNTLMNIAKNECTWKAVEWAQREPYMRTMKATFSSEAASQEFHSNYLEGVSYAQQIGFIDELPMEHPGEEVF